MRRLKVGLATVVAGSLLALTGCAGEGSGLGRGSGDDVLNIDYATYNHLGLVIRDQGWLEDELGELGMDVNWVFSSGSNKANEYLRSSSIDIGVTGAPPAVQARANGLEIETIMITQETAGFAVVVPSDSDIEEFTDLAGHSIAVTRGTDAYYFLLQALDQHGMNEDDVTMQNLQHADGRAGLDTGSVDAWSGIDPILSNALIDGEQLLYTDPTLIPGLHLNVSSAYAEEHPEIVQVVVDAYAKAQDFVVAHPDEAIALYAEEAGISLEVAEASFANLNFDHSQVPDAAALAPRQDAIGDFMVASGDVVSQENFDEALATLYNTSFAEQANPSRFDDANN